MKTAKDIERAKGLEWRGHTFGGDILYSNAKKMAKSIKDPQKILGRLEAVKDEWRRESVSFPFCQRAAELNPGTDFSRAYHSGIHDGTYSMSIGQRNPFGDNHLANYIYGVAFTAGRNHCVNDWKY